jgi:hypothetical protein|tara:strand:- start:868 stop:1233 length:366 start_codon:yes stop_codon:yes gene_type:complete
MIKLKDLIKEEVCNCGCGGCETELKEGVVGAKNAFSQPRNFGEPLPTLDSVKKDYQERIQEGNIKVVPAKKIDSRTWRQMKYDLRDQFDELVKVGEDYGVFQNAQGTARMLKQIKKLMDKI